MSWDKLLYDQWQGCDLPHLIESIEQGEFADMTKEQAEVLSAKIREQFPFHHVSVTQSADRRNAPRNWFIGVQRVDGGNVLLIHGESEWKDVLLVLGVLKD